MIRVVGLMCLLAASAASTAAFQPKGLRIVVVAGEDAVNIIQQKTAVAPVVEVRDENDLPVAGVPVTFSVIGGKSAAFGVAPKITVTTNAAGRAAATGFTPLTNGAVQIEASVVVQGQTVATTITQTNVMTAAQAGVASGGTSTSGSGGAAAGGGGGGGLSNTAILAVVGAAAAGAGALVVTRSEDAPPAVQPGVYRGSFTLTGNGSVIDNCVFDEFYTVDNAEIRLTSSAGGVAIVPVFFQFTSRDLAICGNATTPTVTYEIPIALQGSSFSSRQDFPANSFFLLLEGQFSADTVSGTMRFVRTGGAGGTGTIQGNYQFPRAPGL